MAVSTKINCGCGGDLGYRVDATTAECWDCNEIVERVQAFPNIGGRMWNNGDGDSGGRYIKQAGRSFHSEREMHAWADAEGLDIVSATDSAWTSIRDTNRNENDKDAQKQGYTDAASRSADIAANGKDMLANNRQKKIDAYHDENGTEGRETVEGTTFGALD